MSEAVQKRMEAWAALLCYGAYVSRGDLRRARSSAPHPSMNIRPSLLVISMSVPPSAVWLRAFVLPDILPRSASAANRQAEKSGTGSPKEEKPAILLGTKTA